MKKIILLSITYLFIITGFSQQIEFKLKSGDFTIPNKLTTDIFENGEYRMLFFSEIPTNDQKLQLERIGVEFLYYLPPNIFVVYLNNNLSTTTLEKYNIISCNSLLPEYKIDYKLKKKSFPEWTISGEILHLKLLIFKNVNIETIVEDLNSHCESINEVNNLSNSVTVSINKTKLNLLSELEYISYIEPIDPPTTKENDLGRTLHRTNVIDTEYNTGRKYNGDGVNVMMHDDGYVEPHIDRKGRVDEQFCNSCSSSSGDSHGDHVSGTIMGAGNLDP